MIKWIPLMLAVCAVVGASVSHFAAAGPDTDLVLDEVLFTSVDSVPIQLDPEDAAVRSVGKTKFVGGWALTSKNDSFGGYSGLIVDVAEKRMLAISDKGEWWSSRFDPAAMEPPSENAIFDYTFDVGESSKTDLDAESIIAHKEGVLISFEQRHRLEWMRAPGQAVQSAEFMQGVSFDGVSDNGGMEAITLLVDGRLLAFAERGLDRDGHLQAWLSSRQTTEPLFFKPPTNFAPTDAATLPNGDVLVLLRHYSIIDGVAAKVHHIKAGDIRAGAVLTGTEVLHLTPQLSVDNMEGLDVVALNDNTVRMVMISDDNFNPLQRTLLMVFDYQYR